MNFTHAARELSVTQSTISHEVKALEEYFGLLLFKRARSGLSLTAEGRRLAEVAQTAFSSLGQVGSGLAEFSISGTITVAAPPIFALGWLMPRIAAFSRDHPDIAFRFVNLTEKRPELLKESDITILWEKSLPNGVDGQKLFEVSLSPVANPATVGLRRSSPPPENLLSHRLLHESDLSGWRGWFDLAGLDFPESKASWVFDDPALMIDAAAKGYGIALGSFPLNDDLVAEGKLIKPFDLDLDTGRSYYLATSGPATPRRAVRLFANWLAKQTEDFDRRSEPK
ncbi:MAG: LysR substrate-binding domain-containing protein [Marivita sp.]|nr:LysR substrate-binding domain-containing protein [Marivita sp.]